MKWASGVRAVKLLQERGSAVLAMIADLDATQTRLAQV